MAESRGLGRLYSALHNAAKIHFWIGGHVWRPATASIRYRGKQRPIETGRRISSLGPQAAILVGLSN